MQIETILCLPQRGKGCLKRIITFIRPKNDTAAVSRVTALAKVNLTCPLYIVSSECVQCCVKVAMNVGEEPTLFLVSFQLHMIKYLKRCSVSLRKCLRYAEFSSQVWLTAYLNYSSNDSSQRASKPRSSGFQYEIERFHTVLNPCIYLSIFGMVQEPIAPGENFRVIAQS